MTSNTKAFDAALSSYAPERRSGKECSEGESRTKKARIRIFLKLAAMSTLLICLVIATISFSILRQQEHQFTTRLMDLAESLVRMASNSRKAREIQKKLEELKRETPKALVD